MYHKWENGSLELDVTSKELDGSEVPRRVTLTPERLLEIMVQDPDGLKWVMNHASKSLSSRVKMKPGAVPHLLGAKNVLTKTVSAKKVSKEDVLPPQIRELEDRLIDIPVIDAHYFPVEV